MDDARLGSHHAPDRRAQAAARLAAELRCPSARRFDPTTRSCVEFLIQRRRFAADYALRRVQGDRFADLATAYEIREAADEGLRYSIEAQLLTERPPEEIARAAGVTEAAILFYREVFFDVRDRLNAPHYIVLEVLEHSYRRNPEEWRDFGWKTVAYTAGLAALDIALGVARVADRQEWLESVRAQSQLIFNDKLRRLALLAGDENSATLWKAVQLERATDKSRSDDAPTAFEANAKAFLETVGFYVGKPRDERAESNPFSGAAVELRAEEQVRVDHGEVLANQEELLTLRIPEIRTPDENL